MKNLKFELRLFSLLAILAGSVFLASCNKEDTVITTLDYDNPSFVKEITTQGLNESQDFQFVIEVASNDESLTNAFSDESITMEFLTQNAMDELLRAEADSQNNIGLQVPEDEEDQIANEDIFVKITLREVIAPYSHSLSEMPPYELKINPVINEIIKEMKAVTVLDFEQNILVTDKDKLSSRVDFWNNNKRIHLRADCGTSWTKTKNYWSYSGSSYKRTLNTTWFKCNRYIAVCCLSSNSSKWVRRVTVLNDVLAGYTALGNSCSGFNYCALSADNTCSGYYPNGCWN